MPQVLRLFFEFRKRRRFRGANYPLDRCPLMLARISPTNGVYFTIALVFSMCCSTKFSCALICV